MFGFVAQEKFILDQKSLLDRLKRSANPRVLGRQKANQGDQQQAGIEPLRAVGLHKAIEITVETAVADLGTDFAGDLPPSVV